MFLQAVQVRRDNNNNYAMKASYFRHQSSQACSAAKTINRGRRRIIKVVRVL